MKRRTLIQSAGALAMGSLGAQGEVPRFYLLEQYYLKNGTQGARAASYLKDGLLESTARLNLPGPKLILEALIAQHMPQLACITRYESLEQFRESRSRWKADAKAQAALAQWEADAEAPYEHYSSALLEATPYSPALVVPAQPPKQPRVFELRVYHSPTEKQLKALHERFAGPEIRIFARCGVHPLFYSSTLIGPSQPNLVYLIPFDDLSAREKAWAAFGADPEWVKVRAESIAKSGQISSTMQISLFKGAAYSPIR